jgi:hypothetical protein
MVVLAETTGKKMGDQQIAQKEESMKKRVVADHASQHSERTIFDLP